MYALVDDVAAYPTFLRWCSAVTVHSRDDDHVEASLELQRGTLSKTFTTRNSLDPGKAIHIALVGGPFSHLSGGWHFEQLGQDGSKVSLRLEFEFESRMTDMLFGRYFEDICNSLVDSFTQRASDIYG
jgi:ribosome-associated toxin RatA of RatAB toxin-antitoxin module